MSIQALDWVLQSAPEKGSDLLVLISLANHTNDSHTTEEHFSHAFQSVATIVWETRLSRATVFEVLKRLEASDRISIEHGGDGPKDTNYYSINTANPRPPRKSRKMAKGPDAGPSKGPDPGLKGPDAGPEPSVTSRTTFGSFPSVNQIRKESAASGRQEKLTDPEGIFPSATASTSDTTASARPRSARLRLVSENENQGGRRPDEEIDSWGGRDLAIYFSELDWGNRPNPVNKWALAKRLNEWRRDGLSASHIRKMMDVFHGASVRYWDRWPDPVWVLFLRAREALRQEVGDVESKYDYDDAAAAASMDAARSKLDQLAQNAVSSEDRTAWQTKVRQMTPNEKRQFDLLSDHEKWEVVDGVREMCSEVSDSG